MDGMLLSIYFRAARRDQGHRGIGERERRPYFCNLNRLLRLGRCSGPPIFFLHGKDSGRGKQKVEG